MFSLQFILLPGLGPAKCFSTFPFQQLYKSPTLPLSSPLLFLVSSFLFLLVAVLVDHVSSTTQKTQQAMHSPQSALGDKRDSYHTKPQMPVHPPTCSNSNTARRTTFAQKCNSEISLHVPLSHQTEHIHVLVGPKRHPMPNFFPSVGVFYHYQALTWDQATPNAKVLPKRIFTTNHALTLDQATPNAKVLPQKNFTTNRH